MPEDGRTFEGTLDKFLDIVVNPLTSLLYAVAFLIFVYGVVEFVAGREDETKRSQGKKHMLWGVIGLFIMFAARSILKVLTNTFGIDTP